MLRGTNEHQAGQGGRQRWRRFVGSFAFSTLLHVVLIAITALFVFRQVRPRAPSTFDTIWLDGPTQEVEIEIPVTPGLAPQAAGDSLDPGGTSLGIEFDPTMIASVGDDLSLDVSSPIASGLGGRVASTDVKSSSSAANSKKGSIKPGRGRGLGEGDGVGNGSGPGFFGSVPGAKRIVYVVDSSRSMNAKHDSPSKTRFRRLKVELIKSILELPPESQFFVIFFANEMLGMPAETLQPATPQSKDHYLRWVAQVDPGGSPTDPQDALAAAIRLQPDIIYFLTDGEFKKGVNLRLRSIKLPRTAIHTFAFGETVGEELLKDIARNNGGEYKFVP
ncbi:MAG: VWA domain-containing protein [Candidatus Saccharimonas sp.]|nr:VWA domain-containing protein [Planctomycetaceae bacterium]